MLGCWVKVSRRGIGSSQRRRRRPALLSLPFFQTVDGDDASLRPSPSTTDSAIDCYDHKSVPLCDSIYPRLKFLLSLACGSVAVMLATSTTTTIHPSPRSSFSLFNTHVEFRSMFIATLFLFLFLCLGQYSIIISFALSFSVFAISRCPLCSLRLT
jgi:hypothetical protein